MLIINIYITKTNSIFSYAFQQSEMIVVSGKIHSLITSSRVDGVRFWTTAKKHLPVPRSTPPKTQTPSTLLPRLYFPMNELLYFT
jgi:hypothetical protein